MSTPATLPADFFSGPSKIPAPSKQGVGDTPDTPDTLPANFFSGSPQAKSPTQSPNTLPANFFSNGVGAGVGEQEGPGFLSKALSRAVEPVKAEEWEKVLSPDVDLAAEEIYKHEGQRTKFYINTIRTALLGPAGPLVGRAADYLIGPQNLGTGARAAAKTLTDWYSPVQWALRGLNIPSAKFAEEGLAYFKAGNLEKAAELLAKARTYGMPGAGVAVGMVGKQLYDTIKNWDQMSPYDVLASILGIVGGTGLGIVGAHSVLTKTPNVNELKAIKTIGDIKEVLSSNLPPEEMNAKLEKIMGEEGPGKEGVKEGVKGKAEESPVEGPTLRIIPPELVKEGEGKKAAEEAIGKIVYHGTGGDVTSVEQLNPLERGRPGLVGIGIYFTDNPEVASSPGYGGRPGGRVLGAKLDPSVKLLDAYTPLTKKLRTALDKAVASIGESLFPDKKSDNLIHVLKAEYLGEPKSYLDYMDGVKRMLADYGNEIGGLPQAEAVEIIHDFQSIIAKNGYDGIRYDGGRITGGTPHEAVMIFPGREEVFSSRVPTTSYTPEELASKASTLQSLLPALEGREETGGAPTREPVSGVGPSVPPVTPEGPVIPNDANTRSLANGGITVKTPGKDLGIVAYYLGSLSQSAHRLGNPTFIRLADAIADVGINLARNTGDAITSFRKEVRATLNRGDWNKLVTMLDDSSITPSTIPVNTPTHLANAYIYTRNLLENHRLRVIDAKRIELLSNGVHPDKVQKLVPDDWGIKDGYYVHAFNGNWVITVEDGIDAKGNPTFKPIEPPKGSDKGWRATTLSQAQAHAADYLSNNPNANILIQLDNMTLPGRGISDRKRLIELHSAIKDASTMLMNGAHPEGVMADLTEAGGRLTYGPRRIASRVSARTMQRELNLGGWARDIDTFEHYIHGIERYIELAPARVEIMNLRNKIAEMAGMPDVTKPGELPKRYSKEYANMLGRSDAAIEALEGYPTGLDSRIRSAFQKRGWDPNILDRAYSAINSAEATLKLGSNPTSAIVNLFQTVLTTYPVLREKWTGYGVLHAYDTKYNPLVHELGVESGGNIMDVDTFQAFKGGYLHRIKEATGPKETAGATATASYRAFQDLGLMLFSGTEKFNRRVAIIGAYEKALSEGKSIKEAKNYARDVMARTQFLYTPAEAPIIFSGIPRPALQFKTFSIRMLEFMTGLRGVEIIRFFVGMALTGAAGLPLLSPISKISKALFDYDIEDELKRKHPVASRGLPGLIGVDLTRNVGFADWLGTGSLDPKRLVGPFGSDVINATLAGFAKGKSLMGSPSRSGEVDIDNFVRGLSPSFRRVADETLRMATQPISIDPRTGNIILKNLTPVERVEMIVGLTPIRVSDERAAHEHIRNEIANVKDTKGWFVDRIAEDQVALMEPGRTPEEVGRYLKDIIYLTQYALKEGVADNLSSAVKDRIKGTLLERLQRDVTKAPKGVRLPAYEEMQRFKQEHGKK